MTKTPKPKILGQLTEEERISVRDLERSLNSFNQTLNQALFYHAAMIDNITNKRTELWRQIKARLGFAHNLGASINIQTGEVFVPTKYIPKNRMIQKQKRKP